MSTRQQRELNDATAAAEKQRELTQTRIDIEVAGNRGEAQLAESKRLAKCDVARASGHARSKELLGNGEAARIGQIGLSEASVFQQKISAFGDSRLFALNQVSGKLAKSVQPLVPERLFVMGGGKDDGQGDAGSASLFGKLLALMLAEHAGIKPGNDEENTRQMAQYTKILTDKFKQDTSQGCELAGSETSASQSPAPTVPGDKAANPVVPAQTKAADIDADMIADGADNSTFGQTTESDDREG